VNSLKGKLVKGSFWTSLQRFSAILFNFLKLTILTHFLPPAEFGIFAVALLSFDILDYFSSAGFVQALIQKKGDISGYLNSVWTFRILRSVLVAALLFAVAPLAANFFHSPEAVMVVRAISIVYVVRALVNIADIYLQKNLDFKTNFFYLLGGNVIDFVLAIVFASILRNYWALFIGYIARAVFKCFLSYVIFKYRPRFELEIHKIKELFHFGKWILVSSVITVLAMYLDNILVGKLIGITALGLYQVAFKFSHTGSGELTVILGQVYFPYFSAIQDNKGESEKAYLSMVKLNVIVMSFLVTGMVCLAPSFTLLFLDWKWHSIIGILQILAMASFFNSIVASANPYFKGKGTPVLMFVTQAVKVTALVVFIFLLSPKMGVKGVAYSVLIAELLSFTAWFFILNRMIKGFFLKLVSIVIAPGIASVIMALTISLFWLVPGIEFIHLNLLQFLISGLTGSAVFVLLLVLYIRLFPAYGAGISFKKLLAAVTGGKTPEAR